MPLFTVIAMLIYENYRLCPKQKSASPQKNKSKEQNKSRLPRHIVTACIIRTCLHKHMRTSFRQILPQTALKILAGRQPACGFLPCLQQNYARKSAHISYEDRFLVPSLSAYENIICKPYYDITVILHYEKLSYSGLY